MIGIFDSGLGGLTALKEARRLMAGEDFVYFGDTGRVPYGTRSRETIIEYTRQAMRFMLEKNVRAVLVACGTVSSVALDTVKREFDIPIIGVVDSAADAAISATKNKKIGVIGTGATISSRSFERLIGERDASIETMGVACPLFVSLVENGYIAPDDCVTLEVARRYLSPFMEFGADTLILGCTHFPIISRSIEKILPGVTLISSGSEAAKALYALAKNEENGTGRTHYYVSDSPDNFSAIASIFLEEEFLCGVEKINIQKY